MKEQIKNVLKEFKIYHGLQGSYRALIALARKFNYRKNYKQYKGSGFICNSCGAQYSRFVPWIAEGNIAEPLNKYKVIAGYGENIICPNCLSTARDRLVLAVLHDRIDINQKEVLHMSPEPAVSKYLKSKAKVTSTDIEPGFYKATDKHTRYANIMAMPFADSSFDLIVANHILEHIPDDVSAMKELHRILKPGGNGILQVPFSTILETTLEQPNISDPDLQEKLFGQKDHVRIYEAEDYIARLKSAGFSVTVLKDQDLEAYKKYAIQEGEWMFLVSK